MKYRIVEEFRYNHPTFYIQYWHVDYEEWIAAMSCSFESLNEAKKGVEFYKMNIEKLTEYQPRIIHEVD